MAINKTKIFLRYGFPALWALGLFTTGFGPLAILAGTALSATGGYFFTKWQEKKYLQEARTQLQALINDNIILYLITNDLYKSPLPAFDALPVNQQYDLRILLENYIFVLFDINVHMGKISCTEINYHYAECLRLIANTTTSEGTLPLSLCPTPHIIRPLQGRTQSWVETYGALAKTKFLPSLPLCDPFIEDEPKQDALNRILRMLALKISLHLHEQQIPAALNLNNLSDEVRTTILQIMYSDIQIYNRILNTGEVYSAQRLFNLSMDSNQIRALEARLSRTTSRFNLKTQIQEIQKALDKEYSSFNEQYAEKYGTVGSAPAQNCYIPLASSTISYSATTPGSYQAHQPIAPPAHTAPDDSAPREPSKMKAGSPRPTGTVY